MPTSILIKCIVPKLMPVTLNQQLPARRTVRALPPHIMNIADIDVVQSGRSSDIVSFHQRLGRRARTIHHPKIRMKRGEVHRHVAADGVQHPVSHAAKLVMVIIRIGNHQIGQLGPAGCFAADVANCVENRIKMRSGQSKVEVFGKCFQVNVGRIHGIKELAARFGRDVAGGDSNRLETCGPTGCRRVDRVLSPDHRVVVGKRNAAATLPNCCVSDDFGRSGFAEPGHFAALGNVPVLTELASQVAAGGPKTQHGCSRQEMIERLLLNRIDAKPGTLTVGIQHHPAVAIDTDETETAITRIQPTGTRAQLAEQSAVLLRSKPASAVSGLVRFDILNIAHDGNPNRCPDVRFETVSVATAF